MMSFHQDFEKWMIDAGIALTEQQFDKLSKYLNLLKEKNKELNLTNILEPREMWIKHILDSLIAVPFFDIKPVEMPLDHRFLGCPRLAVGVDGCPVVNNPPV